MGAVARPPIWRWGGPVEELRQCLKRGGILAVPTESSYGLAVDPRDPVAVEALFRAKGRVAGKPLPVLISGIEQLALLGVNPNAPEIEYFARYWPAALSVLAPLSRPLAAAAGAASVAVRVPGHDRLRQLLVALGPLTATSANRSGEPPVTESRQAARLLQGVDAMIVDDGELPGGPPSTVVALERGAVKVLRHGRFSAEDLIREGRSGG